MYSMLYWSIRQGQKVEGDWLIKNLEQVGLLVDPPGFGPREMTVDGAAPIDRDELVNRWNSMGDVLFMAWSDFEVWEGVSLTLMNAGQLILVYLDGLFSLAEVKRVAELVVEIAMDSPATIGVAGALGLEDYFDGWALYFEREMFPAPQEFEILFDPRRSPLPLLGGRFIW